jgi:hypothetical protein
VENDSYGSIVTEALRSIFGPIVKQSAKWPPILAYGVPCIIVALLIVLVRSTLPENMLWLLLILILAPLAGYIFSDWDMRRQDTAIEKIRQTDGPTIRGNVFFEDGFPIEDAMVTVDGMDRRRTTDENGWFQIEVNRQREWVVRAIYKEQVATSTVAIENVQGPIKLVLPRPSQPGKAEVKIFIEPNLLALLEIEKERCRERNIGFYTPNLLSLLLSPPTSLPRRIFERAVPDKAAELIKKLRSYTPPEEQEFTEFDWYDRRDVQAARHRAQEEGKEVIDGRLLLLGILATESETRGELIHVLGQDGFERLVRSATLGEVYTGTPGVSGLFNRPPAQPDT